MAKNLLTEFLESYKELETTIRTNPDELKKLPWVDSKAKFGAGTSVLDVENSIADEDIKDKLKLCRIMRNYAQHHDDAGSFVSPTTEMVAFVKRLISDIQLLNGTYKDIMTKCPVVLTTNSNVTDCGQAFMRTGTDWYPVSNASDGTYVGFITKSGVVMMLGSGCTLKTHIKDIVLPAEKSGVTIVKQTDPVPLQMPSKRVIVVNTKGKIVGIVD